MVPFKIQLVKYSLFVISSFVFVHDAVASDFYLAGQFGQSKILSDDYFDMLEGESKLDDKSINYGLAAGLSLSDQLHIELEVGLHQAFVAQSEFNYSYEELSLENSYARVNVKYDFNIAKQFDWYAKGGLGIARVEQSYRDATGNRKSERVDNLLSPAVAIGLQKSFDRHFLLYLETQYSGYRLQAEKDNINISYATLSGGVKWTF
ncbi:MAG: porin family protein [Psychromonas sp.]|nr:porin family protein [Alteromonadales bacterium]MCP5077616.1 porin family protein [Psychromonas sp.]